MTQAQAISGLGGIGKTQTALEYAYRYGHLYHYVLWVSAATPTALLTDFVKLAALLDVPGRDEQDQQKTVEAVKAWFSGQRDWLLILDNADDLELAASYFPEGTSSNGHILLTTRAQNAGALAELVDVEKMDGDEGALLLLRRARVLSQEATLEQATARDRAGAQAIVAAMDGLPLALDQVGAYLQETASPLSDYLKLYERRRKDLLARRGHLPPGHPETVATTWSLSFQQVEQANPASAELLRLCAFLAPDGIPEGILSEGAADLGKVLGPVAADEYLLNEAIEVLRRYSLVRRNAETKLLSVHRLVQAVLIDAMKEKTQRLWAERAVRAVNSVFPEVDYGTWSKAERYLSQVPVCVALIDRYGLAFPEAANLLYEAGYYWYQHAEYTQAELLYQRALRIYKQVKGPEHLDTANTLDLLARLYLSQGKYEQVEPLLQRALCIREQVKGPENPHTAVTLHELAGLYLSQGKYEQAEPLLQRALHIFEQVEGPEHHYTATTLHELARLYLNQGKYEQAEPLLQRALRIREQVKGPEHPDSAVTLHELARLYLNQGKYEQAEPLFQQALRINEQVRPEHPYTAITLQELARLYLSQGKYEQAEPLFQRALRINEQVLGPEHPSTAITVENYAYLLRLMKREREAALLEARFGAKEKKPGSSS